MTNSYVWHDSVICVTWPIHMCDTTQSYVCHDSFAIYHSLSKWLFFYKAVWLYAYAWVWFCVYVEVSSEKERDRERARERAKEREREREWERARERARESAQHMQLNVNIDLRACIWLHTAHKFGNQIWNATNSFFVGFLVVQSSRSRVVYLNFTWKEELVVFQMWFLERDGAGSFQADQSRLQHTAAHNNTLQHTATYSNTLQHTAITAT